MSIKKAAKKTHTGVKTTVSKTANLFGDTYIGERVFKESTTNQPEKSLDIEKRYLLNLLKETLDHTDFRYRINPIDTAIALGYSGLDAQAMIILAFQIYNGSMKISPQDVQLDDGKLESFLDRYKEIPQKQRVDDKFSNAVADMIQMLLMMERMHRGKGLSGEKEEIRALKDHWKESIEILKEFEVTNQE